MWNPRNCLSRIMCVCMQISRYNVMTVIVWILSQWTQVEVCPSSKWRVFQRQIALDAADVIPECDLFWSRGRDQSAQCPKHIADESPGSQCHTVWIWIHDARGPSTFIWQSDFSRPGGKYQAAPQNTTDRPPSQETSSLSIKPARHSSGSFFPESSLSSQ